MKKSLLFSLLLFLTGNEVVLAGCISGDCKNGYGSYQWTGRGTYTGMRLKSQGSQIPWENSSIEGDFYFVK